MQRALPLDNALFYKQLKIGYLTNKVKFLLKSIPVILTM